MISFLPHMAVSYTHLDVYKRQAYIYNLHPHPRTDFFNIVLIVLIFFGNSFIIRYVTNEKCLSKLVFLIRFLRSLTQKWL